jgi:hypothetical protein
LNIVHEAALVSTGRLPRRWIVERTLAWLNRCRELAKEWQNLYRSALVFLKLASIAHFKSAFAGCGHCAAHVVVKTQKFILGSALRPNQIPFSHSLGQQRTYAPQQNAKGIPLGVLSTIALCQNFLIRFGK